MTARPGVFLGAMQGKLSITGVYVRASNTGVPDTSSSPASVADRPFVFASQGSTMVIKNSTFSYLGRNWNSSYGLTWSNGSTGSVSNSTFDQDYIGVYSSDSSGLKVMHDKFYHCTLYGIDPHSGSSHLSIEYNISDFNGRHGIIFSNHVTDSIVQYNVTKGNGLNGIMMDEASAHNIIIHNTVTDNGSDGVVIANSSSNVISDNAVSGNRVGITVRGNTTDTKVYGNKVIANIMASQGVALAGNTVYGNGGQWSARRIGLIWLSAFALLLVLFGITRAMKWRRTPNHRAVAANI